MVGHDLATEGMAWKSARISNVLDMGFICYQKLQKESSMKYQTFYNHI